MDDAAAVRSLHWVGAVRSFLKTPAAALERCEICSDTLGPDHPHLIEPQSRRLLCACQGCALLFTSREAKRYRRVLDKVMQLSDFKLSDAQWDAFLIPISMAFFVRSSTQQRVLAMYPGPTGTIESRLELDAWKELEAANPDLAELEEDTEALLINRVNGARDYYRVSIDRCYQLGGLIRRRWKGLSGGDGVRGAIDDFFSDLHSQPDARGAHRRA